jgi:hypothetical protein
MDFKKQPFPRRPQPQKLPPPRSSDDIYGSAAADPDEDDEEESPKETDPDLPRPERTGDVDPETQPLPESPQLS